MFANSKNIRGTTSSLLAITNDDVNASWLTVTGDVVTANTTLFVGAEDVMAKIDGKQNVIDGTTDITMNDLTSASITNAGDIGTATLTATGNISGVGITATGNISGVDITASGNIVGDDINIDGGNVLMSSSSQSKIGFGVSDLTNDNGFRIDEFFLSPSITVPSIYMGLKGTDHSIVLAGSSTSDPAYSFVNTTTGDYQGKIVYNMGDNRMEFFTDGDVSGGNHKLKLSNTVADFQQNIRGNNGLTLQGSGDLTITTGGDIVNSSGNIRTTSTTADIYAENSDVYAINGDLYSTNGNIYATNGDITGVNVIAGSTNLLTEINTKQDTLTTSSNIDVNAVIAKGFQVHATNSAGIEMVANGINDIGYIDFSYGDPADDYHGRFSYDFNDDMFIFTSRTPNATPLTIAHNEIYARVPLVSESNMTCQNLTVNGTLTATFNVDMQQVYVDSTSAPHITIDSGTSTGAFQLKAGAIDNVLSIIDESDSEKFSVDKYGGVNCVDVSSSSVLNIGNITTDTLTVEDTITCTDDLVVGSDVLHVDTSINKVGINVLNPTSALQVVGTRDDTTELSGGCVSMGANASGNYGVEIASPSGNSSMIDFTHDDNMTDWKARLLYVGNTSFNVKADNLPIILNPGGNHVELEGDTHLTGTSRKMTIGGSNGTSALSVVGTSHNGNTSVAGVHMALQNGNNACLELCSNTSSDLSYIDFTYPNTDKRGRAIYDFSDDTLKFEVANSSQMIISNTNVDFQGNTISDVNLNSVKGQLISYLGEESGALNINQYDFNYGNGRVSDSAFGMVTGVQSLKLKRFTYAGNVNGSYTTATRIVFRLWIDRIVQNVYMFCDFSNTTNGSLTYKRFNNKFSSSATSQVDIEPTITKSWGVNLSWQTVTLTSYDTATVGHRISVICETQDDL